MKATQWVDIPKWNNYQVSTNGEVKNAWTNRILKPSIDKRNGVYRYRLSNKNKLATMSINNIYKKTFGIKIKTTIINQWKSLSAL